MSLLANPSHLEAVDPVVLGKVLKEVLIDSCRLLAAIYCQQC